MSSIIDHRIYGQKTSEKSRGQLTQSNNEELNTTKISNTDLEGNARLIYSKNYANPHNANGVSKDVVGDMEKTKKLQEYLKQIKDDAESGHT